MTPQNTSSKQNPRPASPRVILKVVDVSKHFGGIKALDHCTLEIHAGEITAIIGPNGSGKTTLFDAITSLIPVDYGKIILNAIDITTCKDFEVAKHGISRTFQQVRLFKNMTIKEHLAIALSSTDESLAKSVWDKLFHHKREESRRMQEILSLVHLEKPLDTPASDLSYGQRKLLDLAIALAKPHEILLLDEPVAGVNPKLRVEIMDIIKSLKERGETIIIIEHDMNFVMGLAGTIFVLEAGTMIARGTPREIQNNTRVLEAYLGG